MKTLLISIFVIFQVAGFPSVGSEVKGDNGVTHERTRRLASRDSGRITLALIDRKKSLFRISNGSAKTIHLTTLYMPGTGKEFTTTSITYEVMRNDLWKRLPYSIDGIQWDYPLRPHKTLTTFIDISHFGIDLSNSEIGNVSKGDLVRVWLDEFPSKPFRW